MIDFRYHLVSIVAVFLALAIGIVLGSTELQGATLDGLRQTADSLTNRLNNDEAQLGDNQAQLSADQKFYAAAEPKLLAQTLTGDRIAIVEEPGAPSSVINGIRQAAAYAGATIALTVTLQPQFNDLSGATLSSLQAINSELASTDGTVLDQPVDEQTVNQQQAADLIAGAILQKSSTTVGLTTAQAQNVLDSYAQAGYLTTSQTASALTDPANLAVIVTPGTAPSDGQNDPANLVLLGIAPEFATQSAATVVVGSVDGSSPNDSAMSVLRSSSVSSEVSSVDNADTTLGQISTMWALADQLAGGTPSSYGISGAAAVSPAAPGPAPTVTPTPTPSTTPTPKSTTKVKSKK